MFGTRLIPRVTRMAGRPAVGVRAMSTGLPDAIVHQVPNLRYNVNGGISEFLSPQGLDTAWIKYQGYILDRLTKATVGTEYEGRTPLDVLLATSRNPETAHIFNYASMAHNNQLFFQRLANDPAPMPLKLKEEIKTHFGSVETLRREMIGNALSMFGPGFVWLVRGSGNDLYVVNTYLAGTPYAEAHWRLQSSDMNTLGENKSAADYLTKAQQRLSMGSKITPPGSIVTKPLLCLNTWEHVWLTDYGIENKLQYCVNWWTKIDWEEVESVCVPMRVKLTNPDALRKRKI